MVPTKKLSYLAVIIIAVLSVSGCAHSIRSSPREPIGVMGALDSEIELLSNHPPARQN